MSCSGESEDDTYGPSLPPPPPSSSCLPRTGGGHCERNDETSDEDEDAYMPALPPHMVKASEHADNMEKIPSTSQDRDLSRAQGSGNTKDKCDDDEDDDEEDMYGPAPPPHLLQKKQSDTSASTRRAIVGPVLPSNFVPPKELPVLQSDDEDESGNVEDEEEDDDEELIGPAPPTYKVDSKEYRAEQFEIRARRMKEKLEGKNKMNDGPKARESWMLELPKDKPNFCGLGPRQFLRKTPAAKGDRSVWTDTPADKARKAMMKQRGEAEEAAGGEESAETIRIKKRDMEISEVVDSYNQSKRAKPLIEMHQKKKKKEEDSAPKERRPFSREIDLNVNRFDEAQKNSILKKARHLNDRFSAGNAKFL